MKGTQTSSHSNQGYDPARSALLAHCVNGVYRLNEGHKFRPPSHYQVIRVINEHISTWQRVRYAILRYIVGIVVRHLPKLSFRFSIALPPPLEKPFGIVLMSKDDSIIAFRGTEDFWDMLVDIKFVETDVPPLWSVRGGFEGAKIHKGFLDRMQELQPQLLAAVDMLKSQTHKPCYVTGHSLGAAIAVLMGVALRVEHEFKNVHMYSFAGPRVGNHVFAKRYNRFVRRSYRVVNDADVIPQVPLPKQAKIVYAHVGKKFAFLNQTDNLLNNHGLKYPRNYMAATSDDIPTSGQWRFPVSATRPRGI